jgi:hypothetical protein
MTDSEFVVPDNYYDCTVEGCKNEVYGPCSTCKNDICGAHLNELEICFQCVLSDSSSIAPKDSISQASIYTETPSSIASSATKSKKRNTQSKDTACLDTLFGPVEKLDRHVKSGFATTRKCLLCNKRVSTTDYNTKGMWSHLEIHHHNSDQVQAISHRFSKNKKPTGQQTLESVLMYILFLFLIKTFNLSSFSLFHC